MSHGDVQVQFPLGKCSKIEVITKFRMCVAFESLRRMQAHALHLLPALCEIPIHTLSLNPFHAGCIVPQ